MIKTAHASRVSPYVERRSQTMKVERLSPTLFRVIPSEPGKAIRIVEFLIDGDDCAIDCSAESDRAGCPSNDHARLCSHCFAAIKVLLEESS